MRVAIIGAGGMGHAWTKMVTNQPEVELGAFVDPLIGTANAPDWLETHQAAKVTSLAQLSDKNIEAVIITAQSPAHEQVIREALELGFHVIVEKPFVTTLAAAEALVELAAKQNKYLMVSHNYRFFPGTQMLRQIVKEGRYGAIHAVIGRFWIDWAGKPYQHKMLHPMALEMAIHHFDMARAIFDAEAVAGQVAEWNPSWSPYQMGAALEALFTMQTKETGQAGQHHFPFLYSGSLVGKAPHTPWGGLWRFEFEAATLVADEIDGTYGLFEANEEGYQLITPFAGETMMLDASFKHFLSCIRDHKEPWSSGKDNMSTLKMALAFNQVSPEMAGAQP